MNDDDLIGEMLWIAFKNDVGVELAESAGLYIKKEKLTRLEAYKRAFTELNLKT